jgi:small redox-active disulfide protein 2
MMKHIQVLGVGCAACKRLRENAEAAVAKSGVEATVEMISDIGKIVSFDVLMTPALVIDGDVKVVGRVATVDDIKRLLE